MTELSHWKRFYHPKRRALVKQFGGTCMCGCGSKSKLEFAHRIPTGVSGRGRGSYKRLNDVMMNSSSYILLSKLCHRDFDNGKDVGINS